MPHKLTVLTWYLMRIILVQSRTLKDREEIAVVPLLVEAKTPLSVEMEMFWPSARNKLSLERLIHEAMIKEAKQDNFLSEVILGHLDCQPPLVATKITHSTGLALPELNFDEDEADLN